VLIDGQAKRRSTLHAILSLVAVMLFFHPGER
jgi:hypothetical protein